MERTVAGTATCSLHDPRESATYIHFTFFLISAKSLLNNALLEFDSFYNAP
jgi:hypothetical protein